MLQAEERKTSTHKVEIVPVSLQKHPNADTLSVIPVFGYTYIGKTSEWANVKRAAYLPPDSLVDIRRPEFSFLADQAKQDGKARIKAKKLRGIVSFGLLTPVPDDTPLGEDWAERLGVEHFEPKLNIARPLFWSDIGELEYLVTHNTEGELFLMKIIKTPYKCWNDHHGMQRRIKHLSDTALIEALADLRNGTEGCDQRPSLYFKLVGKRKYRLLSDSKSYEMRRRWIVVLEAECLRRGII